MCGRPDKMEGPAQEKTYQQIDDDFHSGPVLCQCINSLPICHPAVVVTPLTFHIETGKGYRHIATGRRVLVSSLICCYGFTMFHILSSCLVIYLHKHAVWNFPQERGNGTQMLLTQSFFRLLLYLFLQLFSVTDLFSESPTTILMISPTMTSNLLISDK